MSDHVLLQLAASDGPALELRPWRGQDAAALLELAQDPQVRMWTTLQFDSVEDAELWIDHQSRSWADGSRYAFAVFVRPDNDDGQAELAGHVVAKASGALGVRELGGFAAPRLRGQGGAGRVLEAVARWALSAVPEIEELRILHDVGNEASCRVATKSGFVLHDSTTATEHVHVRRRTR